MTEVITLEAQEREKAGKGAARAERKAGLLPIVIYGQKKPAIGLTISQNEVIRLLNKGPFKSSHFHIVVGKTTHKVKLQATQLHPVRNQPIHLDFIRVD